MWSGILPAVTTKFTQDDRLDHAEMERCFALHRRLERVPIGHNLNERTAPCQSPPLRGRCPAGQRGVTSTSAANS